MHDARLVTFFRRAVLMALALPGCGGSSSSGVGTTPIPSTPCEWAAGPRTTCSWSLTFQGDPTACAGFASTGTAAQCLSVCGASPTGAAPDACYIGLGGDGGVDTLSCQVTTGSCHPTIPPGNGGRRPAYFAALGFSAPQEGREVGVHFARVACMEAGSVEAFRILRDELAAHRAPRRLVSAASRAMRDEVRHVRMTAALARRFGEAPVAAIVPPRRAVRSLEAMAIDNAVEGCVRETYSALECLWQAEVAKDPVVRASMKRIARDEMRHLALSWAVHGWALGRLGPEARARVQAAQRREIAALLRELEGDPEEALVGTAGLPRGHQSRALVEAIAARAA